MKTLDSGTKALLTNVYYDLWLCLIIPVLVVMGNTNIMRKLYKIKHISLSSSGSVLTPLNSSEV